MRCEYSVLFECKELKAEVWFRRESSIPFVPLDKSEIDIKIAGISYYAGVVHYTEWYDDDQYLHICVDMLNKKMSPKKFRELIKDELMECKWQICDGNTSFSAIDIIRDIREEIYKENISQR